MKKLILTALFFVSIATFGQFSLPVVSPRQKIEQQFSLAKVIVDYGRPALKGRKVFGELVPYGEVWRLGANSATKITFEQTMIVDGKLVSAGTYGLFAIPYEKEWSIILNKDAQQWGAFNFDEKLNVAEVRVPVQKSDRKQEYFLLELEPVNDQSLNLIMIWDDVKVEVPLHIARPEAVQKIVEKLKEIKEIYQPPAKK